MNGRGKWLLWLYWVCTNLYKLSTCYCSTRYQLIICTCHYNHASFLKYNLKHMNPFSIRNRINDPQLDSLMASFPITFCIFGLNLLWCSTLSLQFSSINILCIQTKGFILFMPLVVHPKAPFDSSRPPIASWLWK